MLHALFQNYKGDNTNDMPILMFGEIFRSTIQSVQEIKEKLRTTKWLEN